MPRWSPRIIFVYVTILCIVSLTIHFTSDIIFHNRTLRDLEPEILIDDSSVSWASLPGSSFRNYSFIRSVFRISDYELRVSIVRTHRYRSPLYFKYGNTTGIVNLQCELPTCLDYFSKPCNLIGQIGSINVIVDPSVERLYFSKDTTSFTTYSNIIDVRVDPSKYPHTLGVCVQPIFLHADYFLFINFFEFWLSQGATKFFIYRESYTEEVHRIFDFYQATSNASIEFVDWSLLPAPVNSTSSENPNNYVYRLEMMLSIFDCISRARGQVKFVAQTDLDEFIHIKSNLTVAEYMEAYSRKYPNFASASFRSQRISFNEKILTDIVSPQTVNFSYTNTMLLEDYIFDRPFYSKIIYRPERVKRVHTHKQELPELIPGTEKKYLRYENKLIDVEDGVVLHMRRSQDNFEWKKVISSHILSPLSAKWTESYEKRLSAYDFGDVEWRNNGYDVVQEVEKCRKSVYKSKNKHCYSIFKCVQLLSDSRSNLFLHVKNSWIFV